MIPSPKLRGTRVLIIEDEIMIRMLFEDMLAEIGCQVAGTAGRLDAAMEMIASVAFDVAVLDVNLDGRQTFPIADDLTRRGIPYLFATGYSAIGIPDAHLTVPRLQKPFRQRDLERALTTILATVSSRGREGG